MKVKITPYKIVLNVFLLSVLGGLAYFIWICGSGLPWYYRLASVVGLFSVGALALWLSSLGFGATAVYVINPGEDRRKQ